MAANGHRLAITDNSQIDVFDVDTMQQRLLPDPYGSPIDVAIGKDGSIYGLNFQPGSTNVVVYRAGSSDPAELTCSAMTAGAFIAVDNEGDVYISGTDNDGSIHLAKIPMGSTQCKPLLLRPQEGYPGGLAIDPKTDDLLVMDNPGVCAGPPEGRLAIYRKPYRAKTAIQRVLGGVCTSGLRLDAQSTTVFYGDQSLDKGQVIRQASYPAGKQSGPYSDGGTPLGFTTIPNTLPN